MNKYICNNKFLNRIKLDLFTRPPNNFAHLDGLRAIASIFVVAYHCAMFTGLFFVQNHEFQNQINILTTICNGLWSGIDIFFVLSGFLIGRILFKSLFIYDTLHYKKFIIRRFFRIFPAYYFILCVSLFIIAPINLKVWPILFGTTDLTTLFSHSWANFLYVSNYAYPGNHPNILSWGWSLCMEEQFYFILPPLLWVLSRFKVTSIHLLFLFSFIAFPVFGRLIQYINNPSIILIEGFYYFSHNRFDEMFFGVFIAYLYVSHNVALQQFAKICGHGLWIMGFLCFGLAWNFGGLFGNTSMHIVWQFSLFSLGTSLLIICGLFMENHITKFLSISIWYPLARISYGTYLIHPFVLFTLFNYYIEFTETAIMKAGTFFIFYLSVFTISSLFAAFMFLILERPMLDFGVKLNRV